MRYSGYDYWKRTLIAVLTGLLMISAFSCGEGDDQPDEGNQELAAPVVEPSFISGNPTCGSLEFGDFEFKIQPVTSGTYSIDGINDITINVYSTSDGQVFDWTSDLPIDAIVVKGGPNANLYDFTPDEYTSGTGYHSPTNPNNGRYYGLSHISFCYDYNVVASKTADTSFTRTFDWTIEKLVSPGMWHLFTGDSGTSEYTVSVEKTGYTDSDWKVSGNISVENPTPHTATITDVSDMLSNGMQPTVDCGVTFPHSLPAGQTLTCSYMMMLPDASSLTNEATVTTSGNIGGDTATAPVDFGSASITKVNDTINVDDTNGMSWTTNDNMTWTYTRTFSCDGDEGTHDNTATIRETDQSSSASVTVTCYAPTVEKDGSGLQLQEFGWEIQKYVSDVSIGTVSGEGGVSILEIYLDSSGLGTGTVEYTVLLNLNTLSESYSASGSITISNPNPTLAATINDVNDVLDGGFSASVDCGSAAPYTIPAGGSLTCTYTAILPDAAQRTNTATATLQNHDYASDGTPTMAGTTDYSGTAEIIFTDPQGAPEVGVTDNLAGPLLGSFSDSTQLSPYSLSFDQDDCGELVTNIASFSFGADGNDDADVQIVCIEPPDEGCTPGYWKNHLQAWGPTGYAPNQTVESVFSVPSAYGLGGDTLLTALEYPGGPDLTGAARILLRAAVAALLNASHPNVDYARSAADVISDTNAALNSGNRGAMLSLASQLDADNNDGCPLGNETSNGF